MPLRHCGDIVTQNYQEIGLKNRHHRPLLPATSYQLPATSISKEHVSYPEKGETASTFLLHSGYNTFWGGNNRRRADRRIPRGKRKEFRGACHRRYPFAVCTLCSKAMKHQSNELIDDTTTQATLLIAPQKRPKSALFVASPKKLLRAEDQCVREPGQRRYTLILMPIPT